MDAFVGGLLLLIGLAVGAYFRGRYSKAGEIDAINSRLDDIVRHAEATTLATRTIESKIARADWAEREITTLRQTKLEELLRAIYRADDHLREKTYAAARGENLPIDNSVKVARALCALYFQDLWLPVQQFALGYSRVDNAIVEVERAVFEPKKLKVPPSEVEHAALLKAMTDANAEVARLHKELQQKILIIEGKAGGLINKIVGQPIGTEFDYEKLLPLVETMAATGTPINKPATSHIE
jgi:hypothetical protein